MKNRFRILFFIFLFCFMRGIVFGNEEWKRLTLGSVVLFCHEKDMKNGEKVISIIQESYNRIAEDFGLSEMGRVTVTIASSEKEFDMLTGGQIPEWGIAASDSRRFMFFLKSPRFSRPAADFRQVVVHELTHLILGMAMRGREVDRWFEEGVAMYESGETGIRESIILARALFSGEILWLDEIDEVLSFRRSKAALAYQESYAAVNYIVENYGRDALSKIIQALGEGQDMDKALQLSLGSGFQDFQTDWYHYIKQKYKWYVLLDFHVLIGVIFVMVFFSTFLIKRRQIQKKKKVWESEALYEIKTLDENTSSS